MMRYGIYLLLGALFVINIFVRKKVFAYNKKIQENNLIVKISDLVKGSNFQALISEQYPEHAELLIAYRKVMRNGLLLMLTVIGLLIILFLVSKS